MRERRLLELLGVDIDYLNDVIRENPSLRAPIIGYIAERKLLEKFLDWGKTTEHFKVPDHARDQKGDLSLVYRGRKFTLEVKCLQTNSIELKDEQGRWVRLMREVFTGKRKPSPGLTRKGMAKSGDKIYKFELNPDVIKMSQEFQEKTKYKGKFQCDGSDKRKVYFSDGSFKDTTLLRVGEFDIIAAGLFSFRHQWDFGFALNEDLPTTVSCDDPEENCQLIASLVDISWPLEPPFVNDPFLLFDKIINREKGLTTSDVNKRSRPPAQGELF